MQEEPYYMQNNLDTTLLAVRAADVEPKKNPCGSFRMFPVQEDDIDNIDRYFELLD